MNKCQLTSIFHLMKKKSKHMPKLQKFSFFSLCDFLSLQQIFLYGQHVAFYSTSQEVHANEGVIIHSQMNQIP